MRRKYLDNIRWMTVVLVVVYHVFYMYNAAGIPGGIGAFSKTQKQDAVLYVLYPWFMLLLFVVSGMSARFHLESHSEKDFLRQKTTKLLVPSTIGLFVFWWILGYFNVKIGGGLAAMQGVPKPVLYLIFCVSGTGPLWYIQLLWLYSVFLIAFRRFEKDTLWKHGQKANLAVLLLCGVLVWVGANVGNVPVITVYRFGIYGVGYFLGYFVLSHDTVIDRLKKAYLPLGAAAVALGTAFTAFFWGKPYAEHSVLDTPLCNAYAWIAVLAILACMKRWGDRENCFTRFMCRKAWGLYLFHYLPLAVCALYLYPTSLPATLKYWLSALAAFGGALLLYEVIRRIPFLRWCVCGFKKKT